MTFIGVAVLAVLVNAGQPGAPAGPLPDALRAHLKGERLGLVTSVRGMPLGVREALQQLFGSRTLDIAEPGAEWESGGGDDTAGLPTRRMIAAGCSMDHCLVYYERGGSPASWRVALFRWTPEATRLEWGAAAPGGLKTIDEVKSGVLGGTIRGAATAW